MRSEFRSGVFASLLLHLGFVGIVGFSWQPSPQVLEAFAVEIVTVQELALESQAPVPADVQSRNLVLPKKAESLPNPSPPKPEAKKAVKPETVSTRRSAVPQRERVQKVSAKAGGTSATGVAPQATPSATGLPTGSGDYLAAARVGALRASYEQAVASRLEKVKRYPRRALQRNLEGDVLLYLEIGRDGGVIEHSIRKSSGFSFFDGEVLEMVQRVGRFPEIPSDVSVRSLAYLVPVNFRLTD